MQIFKSQDHTTNTIKNELKQNWKNTILEKLSSLVSDKTKAKALKTLYVDIVVKICKPIMIRFQNFFLIFFNNIEECCDSFKIETVGGGNFYQEERLGNYFKIGNSEDGRNVYRQQNGDNYLYYVQDRSVRKTVFADSTFLNSQGTLSV